VSKLKRLKTAGLHLDRKRTSRLKLIVGSPDAGIYVLQMAVDEPSVHFPLSVDVQGDLRELSSLKSEGQFFLGGGGSKLSSPGNVD